MQLAMSASVERQWKVGELACATGLTVRTLHHYDKLGLLVPSERTFGGYRLYGETDVRRLYRIVALRRLGLRLDAISALLDDDRVDLSEILRRQLAAVERQLAEARRLRALLTAIRAELDRVDAPSIDHLIKAMEAMTMHEQYYTPEQLQRLEQRRERLGDDAIEDAQAEWAEIFAVLRAEQRAGTDPNDPRLDPQRRRAGELVEAFTGGQADISSSLRQMWTHEDPGRVSRGMVDRELWEYYRRVMSTGGG